MPRRPLRKAAFPGFLHAETLENVIDLGRTWLGQMEVLLAKAQVAESLDAQGKRSGDDARDIPPSEKTKDARHPIVASRGSSLFEAPRKQTADYAKGLPEKRAALAAQARPLRRRGRVCQRKSLRRSEREKGGVADMPQAPRPGGDLVCMTKRVQTSVPFL
jgi:hypothetical protein